MLEIRVELATRSDVAIYMRSESHASTVFTLHRNCTGDHTGKLTEECKWELSDSDESPFSYQRVMLNMTTMSRYIVEHDRFQWIAGVASILPLRKYYYNGHCYIEMMRKHRFSYDPVRRQSHVMWVAEITDSGIKWLKFELASCFSSQVHLTKSRYKTLSLEDNW